MLNSELKDLGMNGHQISAYWQDKSQRAANDLTDPTNRQQIKDAIIKP